MPQIDILKYNKHQFSLSNFWGNITEKDGIHKSSSKFPGFKLSSSYHIFELEWTPESLTWKINGNVMKKEVNGIPNEPMYVLLSSGIFGKSNGQQFPVFMEVDWVKCYEKV